MFRHQAFALESCQKNLREKYRGDGAGECCDRRPSDGSTVAGGPAAEQRCHAFEVVVRTVGVRQKARRKEEKEHHEIEFDEAFLMQHTERS